MPNPYLKKISENDLPEELRMTRAKSVELREDGTFFEVFGNNPELYKWYVERFYKELFYSKRIDQKTKELLRFRLSTIHGCKFCNQGNRQEALEAGLTQEQLSHLDNYHEGPFSIKEKAVLKLSDQMVLTNQNGHLSKAIYLELQNHFDDGVILELGMIMGILSGIAKFIFAFDLVEREDSCPFHLK